MAKRYHQSKSSRMDESLGERRGKESGKKQSYKSRRHESMGMKGGSHMSHGEDTLRGHHASMGYRDHESATGTPGQPYKHEIGLKDEYYAFKQDWNGSMDYLREKDMAAGDDARNLKSQMNHGY